MSININMEQEICQILDFQGFNEWVEKEAGVFALHKLEEFFDEDDWQNVDLTITETLIEYEMDRFLFYTGEQKSNVFILKSDIINLIKGIANELVYRVLSELTDKGKLTMAWDNEVEEFVWLQ